MIYDITDVIYLNGAQTTLLKEQGVNLDTLTWDKLGDILNASDYYKIRDISNEVISGQGFLRKLGLEVKTTIKNGFVENIASIELPPGYIVNAICSIGNTLIVWPEKSEYTNIHDMYKHSRINILKALTKIMIFKELKQTKIFETAFLAEGKVL